MSPDDPNVIRRHRPQTASPCDAARLLMEQFGEAVRKTGELHREQFQAIVEGDANATRFDLLIHEMSEAKASAKYAYLAHLHRHGCPTTE